jgi:hypothetical protein
MAIEESSAENREAIPPRRPRLKLIDIYTNRGAFSGDELRGIAARAREITSPTTPLHPLPDRGDQEALDESSGELSGGLIDEPPGETQEGDKAYPIEKQDSSPNHSLVTSSTVLFTRQPYHSPLSSPNDSSYTSPNDSPYNPPNNTSDNTPTVPLTENQAILYFCLKQLNGLITNLTRISHATGISEHTLKSCLKKLRQERLIQHSGRQQFKGLTGFAATTLPGNFALQGDRNKLARRLQQIDYKALPLTARLTPLNLDSQSIQVHDTTTHPTIHPTIHRTVHPTVQPTNDLTDHPSYSSSSSKYILLQELVLEDAFLDLDPRSLMPYLDHFESVGELQNFLDMANACISAVKEGRGKPIQNPQGFLFAQLRAGYINPPEGFKSRRIRAQEIRNKQLEEELALLQNLKERERELQFELFVAQLTPGDLDRIDQEAQERVKQEHYTVGSPVFHLRIHKDTILREWFEQRQQGEESGSRANL